jgi:hypothetical protein
MTCADCLQWLVFDALQKERVKIDFLDVYNTGRQCIVHELAHHEIGKASTGWQI